MSALDNVSIHQLANMLLAMATQAVNVVVCVWFVCEKMSSVVSLLSIRSTYLKKK